jgi:osmotically-inducible protein OsmY
MQTALFGEQRWLSLIHEQFEPKGDASMKTSQFVSWFVLAGCLTLTPNVYAQTSSAMPMASSSGAGSGSATQADKKLARDVRKALSKTPHFNVSNVFVKARGGVVTLSGSVPDGAQIEQAAKVAMNVPGVTSVSNHLSLYTKGY